MKRQKLIALKSVLFSIAFATSSMTSCGVETENQTTNKIETSKDNIQNQTTNKIETSKDNIQNQTTKIDNLKIFESFINTIQRSKNVNQLIVNDYVEYLGIKKENEFNKISNLLIEAVLSNEDYTVSKTKGENDSAICAEDNFAHRISISNDYSLSNKSIFLTTYKDYYTEIYEFSYCEDGFYEFSILTAKTTNNNSKFLRCSYFPDESKLYLYASGYDKFVNGDEIKEFNIPEEMKEAFVELLLDGYINCVNAEDILTDVMDISQGKTSNSLSLSK